MAVTTWLFTLLNMFSSINNCWVPSVQTSSEGPGKCLFTETNMCDGYSWTFYLIPTTVALKTLLKHWNILFLTLDFSKQNGVSCKLSNVITSSQYHIRTLHFREQKHMFKQHVNLLIWIWIWLIWQWVKTAIQISIYARIQVYGVTSLQDATSYDKLK